MGAPLIRCFAMYLYDHDLSMNPTRRADCLNVYGLPESISTDIEFGKLKKFVARPFILVMRSGEGLCGAPEASFHTHITYS